MRKIISCSLALVVLCSILFLHNAPVFAEDTIDNLSDTTNQDQMIDESSLFSNDASMVKQETVVDDKVAEELNKKHLGFSGVINTSSKYIRFSPEDALPEFANHAKDQISNKISADFSLDARLQKGIKGFLGFGVNYDPGNAAGSDAKNDITLKEFFVDANLNNKVYFRTGKQLLKWGQGYFWNPTDLINVEKKDIQNMDKVREGTFGTKIHIPNGTKSNTYFFIDMNNAKVTSDVSLSGKYEFLVNNTEMSISTRIGGNTKPMYGFDISGRTLDLDCYGEISLAKRSTYEGSMDVSKNDELVTKACIGATKFFDYGDIKDRISITGEFYYNEIGYDEKVIKRAAETGNYIDLVNYEPYASSKYYLAMFSSVNKFIVPDATLNTNGIMNLVDNSAMLMTGVNYRVPMTDFEVGLNLTGYFGDKYTEATYLGNSYSISLETKTSF